MDFDFTFRGFVSGKFTDFGPRSAHFPPRVSFAPTDPAAPFCSYVGFQAASITRRLDFASVLSLAVDCVNRLVPISLN